MPSSAFLVVADGAVVAAWGEVGRRFMCHSVRKSFLSALYGIYWDRGQIELDKTLADLGIDDWPDPLAALGAAEQRALLHRHRHHGLRLLLVDPPSAPLPGPGDVRGPGGGQPDDRVLPKSDMVIVNRANTCGGESTPCRSFWP